MAVKRKKAARPAARPRRAARRDDTQGATCEYVKPLIGQNPEIPNGLVLLGRACCFDSVTALSAGVEAIRKEHPDSAKNLQDFAGQASADFKGGALLEYAVIIFGLRDEQQAEIMRHVERNYISKKRERPRK